MFLWGRDDLTRGGGIKKITRFLSSRFWSASLPELSRISTFLGWLVTPRAPTLRPLHADSASKSSVLLSEEPSTGQNTPQNFCRGLGGLSEPTRLGKKGGTAPVVDMTRTVCSRRAQVVTKRMVLKPRAQTPTPLTDTHKQKNLICLQTPQPPVHHLKGRPGSSRPNELREEDFWRRSSCPELSLNVSQRSCLCL